MWVLIHCATSDGNENEVYGPFNTEVDAETKKQSLIEELSEGDNDAELSDYEEDFEVLELKAP